MDDKKVVLITGTSTGIGFATAIELAKRSFIVVATLRDIQKAPESLKTVGCDIQRLDVTDEASADVVVDYIRHKYGRCDVLINNAGFGITGNVESISIEDAQRVFDVNVWGVMRMCKKIAPLMRENKGGLILTISSTSGLRGLPYHDIYCSSKFAVEGLLESYRYSVFHDNIRIAVINAGPTQTNFPARMTQESLEINKKEKGDGELHGNTGTLQDTFREFFNARIQKGQSAEDCAKAIIKVITKSFETDSNSGTMIKFWNATADFGVDVINSVKCEPNGVDGAYKKSTEMMNIVVDLHNRNQHS